MTAMPPAAAMASAMAGASVATATGPIPASIARRQTWTIMGSPAISARGLLGSLVAARRAGMRMMGSDMTRFIRESFACLEHRTRKWKAGEDLRWLGNRTFG